MVQEHLRSFYSHITYSIIWKYPIPVIGSVLLVSPMFIGNATVTIMAFLFPVIGLNLLVGFSGYLSFGQALYFGLSAYGTALSAEALGLSFGPSLLSGILLGTILAVFVGILSMKRRGIYFAILTLAFAQLGYLLARILEPITGGTTGLPWEVPNIAFGPININMGGATELFALIFVILLVFYSISLRIMNSPFGQVMKAVRENEDRVGFLGYDTYKLKVFMFTVAGFYAATGGALYAAFTKFIFLDSLHWSLSGDFLIITIIGGIGTYAGPAVGTYVYIALRDILSLYFDQWLLILGIIFIVIVLLAPDGIVGAIKKRYDK